MSPIFTLTILSVLCKLVPNTHHTFTEAAPSIEKRATCKPKTKLSQCDEKVNVRYTYYFYYQSLDIDYCPDTEAKTITWEVYDVEKKSSLFLLNFKDRKVVYLQPGSVEPGRYILRTKMVDSAGQSATVECRMEWLAEPPQFLFVNGLNENTLLNEKYKVDISPSKFFNKKMHQLKWQVRCFYRSTPECKKFNGRQDCVPECKGTSFEHSITNPCVTKVRYNVIAKHGAQSFQGTHVVKVVKKESYGVELRCTKNCEIAKSNPQRDMRLEVRCYKNCKGFDSMKPTFTVSLYGAKNKLTPLSRDKIIADGFKALMKANTLKFNDRGVIKATHGEDYVAKLYFTMTNKEKSPECTIKPSEGLSLVTIFSIDCKPTTSHMKMYPPFMSIYQPKKGMARPLLLAQSANLRYQVVVAAIAGQETQRLTYKGNDIFFSTFEGTLPPIKVKPIQLTPKIVNETLERIDIYAYERRTDRAVQNAVALMLLMEESKWDKQGKGGAYMSIIHSMRTISIEDLYSYKQIGSMLPLLVAAKDTPPEFKVKLSKLCKKLSKLQLNELWKSKYAEVQEAEAKVYGAQLGDCTDHLLDKKKKDDEIRVTPPPEIVSEPSVTEDYANYDNAFANPQVEEIKENAMNTILKSSQAVARTLTAGESYRSKNVNSDTEVKIENGKDYAGMEIKVTGAVVRPSPEHFKKMGDAKISSMVTSYNNDLLESSAYPLVTRILDVAFYDLKNSTENALPNVPVTIILDVISDEHIGYDNYTVTVPADRQLWQQPEIDHRMNVHRLNLPLRNHCVIRFNATGEKFDLEVVITRNRRPNYGDFVGAYKVSAADESSQIIDCPKWSAEEMDEDAFVYVAVLPGNTKSAGETASTKYRVQFTRQACMTFDAEETRKWEPAAGCETDLIIVNDSFKFNCTCTHSSLFSGSLTKIHNKLDEVIVVSFHSSPFRNYIVFVHVAVVFLCYCVALCFEHRRRMDEIRKENMFFLSDNLKNDLYCYLIFVKTGSHAKAGTTSNVMIQIFGDKGDSKPHVLNFPDPEMRLLQRNNLDYYAMTNDTHLGELRGIHLWYDNIGLRPSWYCDNVVILDLQTKREWHFPVDKWLTIRTDKGHEVHAEPSFRTQKSLKNSMDAFFRFYLGGQHLWNVFIRTNDDRITFAQRITVLLSMIYTTFLLNMFLNSPPEFRTSDAFGEGTLRFNPWCITYGLVTCVVCSAIHHPFVYIFRNSHKQQENLEVLTREDRRFSYRVNKAAWCLLVTYVVLLMTYLVTFGFWMTFNTSYFWMISNTFALVFEVVLAENIYLVVVNVITASYIKRPAKYFNFALIKEEIEAQRRVLFGSLGEVMMRPYFKRHYRPMDKQNRFILKDYETHRSDVSTLFGDLCIFLIYVGLLYVICFTSEDSLVYPSNSEMRKMIDTTAFYRNGTELESIVDVDGIYDYINNTIINIIHPVHWYGRYYTVDAGQMIDFNTKVLGVVQLRQQRRVQNCRLPPLLSQLETNCHNPPTIFARYYDKGDNVSSTLGKLEHYSGAGYKTTLGRTMYNSYFIMRLLRKNRWIDFNTKVLFIEFWTYTANTNVFNAVRIIIERDLSGHFEKSSTVFTMQIIIVSPVFEILTSVVLVVFITTGLVLTVKRLIAAVKHRGGYWRSAWNVIDLLIVTLSFVHVYCYVGKNRSAERLLRRLADAYNNEFVDHFELVTLSLRGKLATALLVCLATLRLWKFLRFGTVFRVMERTLYRAARTLLIVIIYHVFTVLAFASAIRLIYGTRCGPFHSFSSSLASLLLVSLNFETSPSHKECIKNDRSLNFVVLSYMIVSLWFFTIYSTTLIIYFEDSKTALSNLPKRYTLKDFVVEETKFLAKSLQREYYDVRLRAGAEENGVPIRRHRKVYPKAKTERYADVQVLSESRLRLMKAAATCTVRVVKFSGRPRDGSALTEEDFERMARVYLNLVLPAPKNDEKLLFFRTKDPNDGHRIKFVSDHRILQMEYVTRLLLNDDLTAPVDDDEVVMGVSGVAKRLEGFRDCINLIKANVENIKVTLKKKS